MRGGTILDSCGDWAIWLSQLEKETMDSFLAKPITAFSQYHHEKETAKGYHGREILELLQNAADQATLGRINGSVHIELTKDYLVVANNGKPFSTGGVLSIENPHLSEKKSSKLVGNKGLGFRSILNWSRHPLIVSGDLTLAYSKYKLSLIEGNLVTKCERYAEELDTHFPQRGDPKLPLLPFPEFPDVSGKIEFDTFDDDLILLCKNLRDGGFSTVIAMPFDQHGAFSTASEQLERLDAEVLLFVEGLSKLSITTPESTRILEERKYKGNVNLLENDNLVGKWHLFKKEEVLPSKFKMEDSEASSHYELAVAAPLGEFEYPESSMLYSYFSTKVELPLRLRCHATLELDQNRNYIIESVQNDYVLRQLAEFIGVVTEQCTKQEWGLDAYLLAKPEGEFNGELLATGFKRHLLESLAVKKIVPTVQSKIARGNDCIGIPYANEEWLPKRHFSDVAKTKHPGDHDFFDTLGVQKISMETIASRLEGLSDLTALERSSLIWGVNEYVPSLASPALLVNEDVKPAKESRVFVRSSDINLPELPDWLTLYFLDKGLLDHLVIKFKTKKIIDLQHTLADFGLLRYSLSSLVEHLVADANRQKKSDRKRTKQIELELRQSVARLFQMDRAGRLPEFPVDLSIPLINQKSTSVSSRKVYLSRYYGVEGLILQGLYRNVDKGFLLAAPDKQDLGLEEHQVIEFMRWIGVGSLPRLGTLKPSPKHFRNALIDSIQLPARLGNYEVRKTEELENAKITNVKTLDHIQEFLVKGDYPCIVAWLATDNRVQGLIAEDRDNANISLVKGLDRNDRSYLGPVLSYVKWVIENSRWMLNRNGEKSHPPDCVFGATLADSAFPRPKPLSKSALTKLQLSKSQVIKAFRIAGVLSGIDELDSDDLYRKLLQLPESDPAGKTAQAFYTAILNSDSLNIDELDDWRNRFLANGKMWGEQSGIKGYFVIEGLRYVDSEGLPVDLLVDLPIVALPKKMGAKKVSARFGLKVINKAELEQNVVSYVRSSDDIEGFERAKPFFCLLRPDLKTMDIERLRGLELVYCTDLSCTISYEGREYKHQLDLWEWVIDDTKLFVVVHPLKGAIMDFASESIGAAIASLFGIAKGLEFALMFRCQHENREELLVRMRGEAVTEDLNSILKEFDQYSLPSEDEEFLAEPLRDEELVEDNLPHSGEDTIDPESEDDTSASPGDSGPLEVEPKKHTPKDPKNRTRISIRKVNPRSRRARGYKLTNAQVCENLAMEFEEVDGRFPLKVAHITGDRGFGCDILSFQTSKFRAQFKDGTNQKTQRILRFIEVKGRKHGSVDIELKGNELKSASDYQERYFLYRVFELEDGEHELGILRAPLSHPEAVEETFLVDLTRAKETKRFHLSRSDPDAIGGQVKPKKDH